MSNSGFASVIPQTVLSRMEITHEGDKETIMGNLCIYFDGTHFGSTVLDLDELDEYYSIRELPKSGDIFEVYRLIAANVFLSMLFSTGYHRIYPADVFTGLTVMPMDSIESSYARYSSDVSNVTLISYSKSITFMLQYINKIMQLNITSDYDNGDDGPINLVLKREGCTDSVIEGDESTDTLLDMLSAFIYTLFDLASIQV